MTDADGGFEWFARDRAAPLLRYGYVLSGNPHDAADLVQEALARLGLAWERIARDGDPEAYVRVTMARLHISRWRRTRRERLAAEVPDRGYTDPGLDRAADIDNPMWQTVAALPPRQRAVLVLRYYEQRTDVEIAQILGVSRVTVRTQASRALAKLRREHALTLIERAV